MGILTLEEEVPQKKGKNEDDNASLIFSRSCTEILLCTLRQKCKWFVPCKSKIIQDGSLDADN